MCVNDSFQFSAFAVHTDLDSFSCQHEKLFGKVQKFFIQKIWPFLIGSNLSANSSQPAGTSFKIYGNNIFGRCEQFTIELTMDISSQQQRKEVIFQARFVKIMHSKTWDRPFTNCLRRQSYTFSPWAKWLKMADRYHLGARRPPYIKLKLIVCRFKKYMMEML